MGFIHAETGAAWTSSDFMEALPVSSSVCVAAFADVGEVHGAGFKALAVDGSG